MDPELKKELWINFLTLGKDALTMSHYDLAAKVPNTNLNDWRKFLNESDVEEFVKKEMKLISDAIQKQLITGITEGGDKSVGRAQIITTLDKLNGIETYKDGPVFIYTFVPLDTEQVQAENTQILANDPFKRTRE